MSFFKRGEVKENDIKPRNQILQTELKDTPEAKEKLEPKDRKRNDFINSIKVSPDQLNKEKLNRKDGNVSNGSAESAPYKEEKIRERGHEMCEI